MRMVAVTYVVMYKRKQGYNYIPTATLSSRQRRNVTLFELVLSLCSLEIAFQRIVNSPADNTS